MILEIIEIISFSLYNPDGWIIKGVTCSYGLVYKMRSPTKRFSQELKKM